MVERKSADIAIDLTPTTLQGIERRGQAKLLFVPMENQAEFLVMNVQSKPFEDKRVRQAVAHAIPQEEIFKSVFFERGKKLFGGGPEPKDATFPQPQGFAYDPERARKLLAEAGYPNGFSTTLSFCTCKGDYFETLSLALKDHLSRVGIQVGIDKYPGARFGELQVAKQMPLYLENQVAWLSLPDYWIRVFYRGNTRTNFSGYVNPALDPLIQQADDARDQQTYDEVAKKMIAIVNEEIPILYFRQAVREVAIDPEITNYAYWFHTLPDVRSIKRK
jgi:peptide/nickel transport system substrate-binding protein